ncbi:efflux RND transporter periplasmic adaptor subunit [Psychrobacter sp. AH5]|jgi:membrane fusion protein (multidrug efflux system)|uniref:Efflux RND transporter periplasmic adaptor subunit n=1 Tax=Psychrobacter pocilloporae TaxID=1775882 RepID=A0ABT6IU54_9GAMM|nr:MULTISPECIES: efflux RND transporter periplasmic adaptor subunit [Psychrobacter]HCI30400.1 efflux RND transporter periplasmic adaptor subunit [Psychrobacter sp.]AOY43338.1 acriflavine resistance protein E precursor [Psychrobacter sp. AntiMn-1]MBZ1391739.1 efflux RND transporter periplasmic adaptor subunit [Psychrobacter pacificensis]MDH4905356.1 efflux RND transporter periplasmic adaptor subunit [Psychrobacter pocilloporae]BBI66979.1 AdeA/AdeI family multidrug efflux RND transporter peripla
MKHSYLALVIASVLSATVLVGCDNKEDAAAGENAQQQMPPAVVNVQTVSFDTVPQVQTFSGRTAAYQTADVRPQVSGVIDEVLFREGSNVKKGQPLYRINTDNYTTSVASGQAAVAQAQANRQTAIANNANAKAELASRQASLAQAINDFQRLKGLVEIDAISKQQYDQAQTQVRTAQAALESARAAVGQTEASIRSAEAGIKTAQSNLDASALDLNRTIVRAPLTGRSDRSSVTAGTLVNASQSEPLVTISRLDPIYVDISQSSSELLQLRQQIAEGKAQAGMNSVELVLEDGSVYPVRGKLALSEAKVDQSTGAVTLRAIFPNPNNVLLPGMYVSARLTQSVIPNAALVPQSAVMRTPKGDSQVYIVDENNQIQVRPVTINGTYDGQWVVTDGLSSGDKLVVIGGSKVKPEQEVVVKPLENANGASATPTAKTPQQAAKTVADDTSEQDTATTTN